MKEEKDLERFIAAQKTAYDVALAEIKSGRKQSHWMWYIFPQLQGLGFSETAKYYGIKNKHEAEAFLQHPILGSRLIRICNSLLQLHTNNAHQVFGSPDDLKLKSSMTLFASLSNTNPVFQQVLNQFFNGEKDTKTLQILEQQS